MDKPVILESGYTYEQSCVEANYLVRIDAAKKAKIDIDEDEGEVYDEASYITCPVTMKPVDYKKAQPNHALKVQTDYFLEKNPWGYEFDPRADYKTLPVWRQ